MESPQKSAEEIEWQAKRDAEGRRITFEIAVALTLQSTPWTLLVGSEKGRRDRTEEERRTRVFADALYKRLGMDK